MRITAVLRSEDDLATATATFPIKAWKKVKASSAFALNKVRVNSVLH